MIQHMHALLKWTYQLREIKDALKRINLKLCITVTNARQGVKHFITTHIIVALYSIYYVVLLIFYQTIYLFHES